MTLVVPKGRSNKQGGGAEHHKDPEHNLMPTLCDQMNEGYEPRHFGKCNGVDAEEQQIGGPEKESVHHLWFDYNFLPLDDGCANAVLGEHQTYDGGYDH